MRCKCDLQFLCLLTWSVCILCVEKYIGQGKIKGLLVWITESLVCKEYFYFSSSRLWLCVILKSQSAFWFSFLNRINEVKKPIQMAKPRNFVVWSACGELRVGFLSSQTEQSRLDLMAWDHSECQRQVAAAGLDNYYSFFWVCSSICIFFVACSAHFSHAFSELSIVQCDRCLWILEWNCVSY